MEHSGLFPPSKIPSPENSIYQLLPSVTRIDHPNGGHKKSPFKKGHLDKSTQKIQKLEEPGRKVSTLRIHRPLQNGNVHDMPGAGKKNRW